METARKVWMSRVMHGSAAMLVLLGGGFGAMAPAQAQDTAQATPLKRYVYVAGGAQVKDTRTGLTWQRCSVGQVWRQRTCVGEPTKLRYDDAIALAEQTPGWRLPQVYELVSLVDYSRYDPAIDLKAFPTTPAYYYWTATIVAEHPTYAWDVNFDSGDVTQSGRVQESYVRLVKASSTPPKR